MKKSAILTLTLILLAGQALAFEFCEDGTQGEDELRIISVDDMLKENSKEWKWEAAQNIEIEIRVENKGDDSSDYVIEAIFKEGEDTEKIVTDSDDLEKEFSLSSGERKSISLNFEIDEDTDAKDYDLYIKFYKDGDEDEECVENSEETITIEKIELCPDEEVDDEELLISTIRDEEKDNDEKWEWSPGNDIEISLELANKDYSERDFTVELIFIDENGEEISLVENSADLKIEKELDEDEEDDFEFEFKIKSGIKEGKYSLYAKAYDSEDDDICTTLKAESKSSPILIKIEKAERKVVATEIYGPTIAPLSSSQTYTVTLENMGGEDEEQVVAIAYNPTLKINERATLKDLKSGQEKNITINVEIPNNVTVQRYSLLFSTEYEYSKEHDYYREASDEDDDIKYYINLAQATSAGKEEVKEEKLENKTEETIVEEESEIPETPTTTITGNVAGVSNESPSWIIIVVLIILVSAGIFFFFKKPKKSKPSEIKQPQVIRRYTAKLD